MSQVNEILCKSVRNDKEEDALFISYVTDFDLIWSDRKSGGSVNGSYWRPKTPPGYFALGHFGWQKHDNPSNKQVMIAVKPKSPDALKAPIDYRELWNDKGSGAAMNGSIWEPIPPKNYVALGTVVVPEYDKPAQNAVMCVRKDLTELVNIGELIWWDKKTGSKRNFSSWAIGKMEDFQTYHKEKDTLLSSGSFVGYGSHSQPEQSAVNVNRVLSLIMPIEEKGMHPLKILTTEERIEELRSLGLPSTSDVTPWMVIQTAQIPFMAVEDAGVNLRDKINGDVHYILERSEAYTCDDVVTNGDTKGDDKTNYTLEYKTGWSKEKRTELSTKTGLKIGYEVESSGGAPGMASVTAKVSTEFSFEFGFTQSMAKTLSGENSLKVEAGLRPSESAAVWVRSARLRVLRVSSDERKVLYEATIHTPDKTVVTYTKDSIPFSVA